MHGGGPDAGRREESRVGTSRFRWQRTAEEAHEAAESWSTQGDEGNRPPRQLLLPSVAQAALAVEGLEVDLGDEVAVVVTLRVVEGSLHLPRE